MDEKRFYAVPILIAVLMLLPCLYVGSYLASIERGMVFVSGPGDFDQGRFEHLATYRTGGEHATWFFYPIHRLDRALRPSYWHVDEERIGVDFEFTVD